MSTESDTIAALLTPLAPGAIGVVALSGPDVDRILGAILLRCNPAAPGRIQPGLPKTVGDDPPRLPIDRPVRCRVVDHGEVLDDAIALRFCGRDGPDAEIHVHGGVRIVQRLLMLLEAQGAKVLPATEFDAATSALHPVERAVDQALIGSPSRRLTRWLLSQRAILPGFLDRFDALSPAEQIAFRRRSEAAVRLVRGLSIAIVGPPNAGKSTLANRLIGHDRIITSDVPGTTRDWVSETAMVCGWPVTLTDTAGIRETSCEIETEAIRRAGEQAQRADLILIVLDVSAAPAERDGQLDSIQRHLPRAALSGGAGPAAPSILVLNKCDLIAGHGSPSAGSDPCQSTAPVGEGVAPGLLVSARTGDGIAALERAIERGLGLDQLDASLPTAFF